MPGKFRLFDGEMGRYRLERGAIERVGGFRPPVPATRGIYLDAESGAVAPRRDPLTSQASLAWGAGSRPLVVATEGGARLPGDWMVPTPTPSGLSPIRPSPCAWSDRSSALGFDKGGRVAAVWQPLPRRVVGTAPGVAYAIERGRSKGLPVLGQPSGEDAVVRLALDGDRMTVSRPSQE